MLVRPMLFPTTPTVSVSTNKIKNIYILCFVTSNQGIERIHTRHLAEKSLDGHLTDDDIKKSKQDIETEIPYLIAFLDEYQHIIHEKEFSRKQKKDRTILTSFFFLLCIFLQREMRG